MWGSAHINIPPILRVIVLSSVCFIHSSLKIKGAKMKKLRYLVYGLSIIFVATFLSSPSNENFPKDNPHTILNKTSSLQIPFIENKGQIENESLRYYAKTFGGTVFVNLLTISVM